jgi:thioredoxin reductase
MTTDLVGHYQGFFDGITGYKLPQGMRSQAERCAASKAVKPKVTELKPGPPSYHFLKSIEVVDRAIIIARGAKARQLDLLELEESGLIKTNHRMATSIPGILSPMILGQDFSARSAPLRATVP